MTMSLVFGQATLNNRSTAIEQAANDLCEDIERTGYEVVPMQVVPHSSPTGLREGGFSHSPEIVEEGVILVATYRRPESKRAKAVAKKEEG